jgi:hypothetical protein
MSTIDYNELRSGGEGDGVPDDGSHVARLVSARVYDNASGAQLVTKWLELATSIQWSTREDFSANGMPFIKRMLDGLGINRAALNEQTNPLPYALTAVEGQLFEVTTQAKRGNNRWFVNTYVEGAATGPPPAPAPVQQELGTDVPVPASEWRAADPVDDDDDIPF